MKQFTRFLAAALAITTALGEAATGKWQYSPSPAEVLAITAEQNTESQIPTEASRENPFVVTTMSPDEWMDRPMHSTTTTTAVYTYTTTTTHNNFYYTSTVTTADFYCQFCHHLHPLNELHYTPDGDPICEYCLENEAYTTVSTFPTTTTTTSTTVTTTRRYSNFGTGSIGVPQEGEFFALNLGYMEKQIYYIGEKVTRFDPYITYGHYLDGEIVDTGMCPSSWVEDIVIDAQDFDAFHPGEYEIRVIYHDAVATYKVRVVVDDQYITGDIDNNGEVNITDVIMLGQYLNESGTFLLPNEGLENVDMDGSDTLDAIDMNMLVSHIAKISVVQESDKSFTYETKTAYDDTKYTNMTQNTDEATEQAVAKLHQLLADDMLAEERAENIPERMEHTAYDKYLWEIDAPFLTRIRFGEVQTLDYMKAGNDFAYQIENVKEAMLVPVAETNTYQYDIYVRQADSNAFVWLGRALDNSPN